MAYDKLSDDQLKARYESAEKREQELSKEVQAWTGDKYGNPEYEKLSRKRDKAFDEWVKLMKELGRRNVPGFENRELTPEERLANRYFAASIGMNAKDIMKMMVAIGDLAKYLPQLRFGDTDKAQETFTHCQQTLGNLGGIYRGLAIAYEAKTKNTPDK